MKLLVGIVLVLGCASEGQVVRARPAPPTLMPRQRIEAIAKTCGFVPNKAGTVAAGTIDCWLSSAEGISESVDAVALVAARKAVMENLGTAFILSAPWVKTGRLYSGVVWMTDVPAADRAIDGNPNHFSFAAMDVVENQRRLREREDEVTRRRRDAEADRAADERMAAFAAGPQPNAGAAALNAIGAAARDMQPKPVTRCKPDPLAAGTLKCETAPY